MRFTAGIWTLLTAAPLIAGVWAPLPPLPEPKWLLAAAAGGDGRIYAIGGDSGTGPDATGTVFAFDPAVNRWSQVASLGVPRRHLAAVALRDGRICAIGGYVHPQPLAAVECYDPKLNTWARRADLPVAMQGLSAATGPGGRVYAMGGLANFSAPANAVWVYDPAKDSWSSVAPMKTARESFASATGSDGRIYVFGGYDGNAYIKTAEVYDPASNVWSPIAPMPLLQYAAAAALGPDGRIYVIGGYDGSGAVATVTVYDPATGLWSTVEPMSTARQTLGAATGPDGRIYAIGGENTYPVLADVEAYTPVLLPPGSMVAPAIDQKGQRLAFGSAVGPHGSGYNAADVYFANVDGSGLRQLTDYRTSPNAHSGANALSMSPDGAHVAYTGLVPSGTPTTEQVHLIDTATGTDRTVVINKEICILPLALCVNCYVSCVITPHLTSDGGKVVYALRRQNPVRVVNADGTGLTQLPIYSGSLAAGPQRVISSGGTLVFTSAAPSGPTFVPSATDLYAIQLDGSNLRNLTKFGNNSAIYTSDAVVSSDGSTAVFVSNFDPATRAPSASAQLLMVRGDGSGLRRLSSGSDGVTSPSLSADGSLAAFVQSGQIHMVRTDGKTPPATLTNFQWSVAQDPVLSDDGSRVVFTIGPQTGAKAAIWSVNADGSNLHAVYAPRWLNLGGVVTVTGSAPISPGAIITAYGANLTGDRLTQTPGYPLPFSLDGVSILVNGQRIPLYAVTLWQANAQLPPDTQVGSASFQARAADGSTTPAVTAEVRAAAPALFTYLVTVPPILPPAVAGTIGSSYWQATAYHGGTAIPADLANPAQVGEALATYGTGLGATNPAVAAGTGAPSSPPARTVVTPRVVIGNRDATVTFSGLVPGLAGVYQVNIIVPPGLTPGLQGIAWIVGNTGQVSGNIGVK